MGYEFWCFEGVIVVGKAVAVVVLDPPPFFFLLSMPPPPSLPLLSLCLVCHGSR